MKNELRNGCTDTRLIDWTKRAQAHEVTISTEMVTIDTSGNRRTSISERVSGSDMWNDNVITKSEGLFVTFNTFSKDLKTCLMLTELDLVILFDDYDDEWEFFGEMTRQQFWNYLGSFPNAYKHCFSTACNNGEYWVKNKE